MLQKIIQFSIKNKLIVGLGVLGLILWGIVELPKLPIDAVPDITNNQVLIITSAPSLGAPDVERFITAPVEQATRNIPGIIEQRSFSRFGLSLVTIVFNDKTDVYWARNQISERLNQVKDQIPDGAGMPELGPVTTGLGEVFQYVIKAKPGYEAKYNLTELRSIQDWIVRKQLLGTEGVADVSSFGGAVKQYEVSVNTERLKSMQISITDIFKALQSNNQNTGGGYIERGPNVLFIRTEGMVKSLNDIENIVVKQIAGNRPLLIRDVADVKMGNAIRFGATVYNDEGEVAGAVVMMLKGENSNKVIRNIKKKIKAIETTLPEGVMIEPFLDRSKMVNNAIGTVEKNLMEGALIIIFVLVIFIGNLRAGLIVASVIPLSMLFAVIMMNFFGVSGNLMSLGALDFGLLVDGAVIIVEAVMHQMSRHPAKGTSHRLSSAEMDKEVSTSAQKMMRSAAFGQIIILIVYLPILTLQGIEGKMFRPMAQTVSFAIIGAFILSLTYVPMMSAWMLSRKLGHTENFSDRMMNFFQKVYSKILHSVLGIPRLIVGVVVIFFAAALLLLTTLGGEFIPKLEEGDFAVDTRLLTGSSLQTTINATQQSAKVLLEHFPEIEKVVTKIGSGEIPTDPMPLEAADMMVILKNKKDWVSAKSFDELAEKMSNVLLEIPGITAGFQYPVQMRFNELMTGARQDVVCKIFGDNLDSLATYASRLGSIIQNISGAKDLYVETVTGIPQLVITYNRAAIAMYGASVEEINKTIASAYAGASAGMVFENDRRFDLVVRMDTQQKNNPDAINNLMIGVTGGRYVPLNQLADIRIVDGPYQIQREDAQRRITVGLNVRGRDVESLVKELQEKIQAQVTLPAGYYVTYGGQYENLQHATKRLSIALPVALLLIFVMLYFGIRQLKYCLLIFSAIPLSVIGGILALWMRGMPFSISAGIGFIALFGVAVLNGIVLINEMIRLKDDGMNDVREIIFSATKTRLRPVLMTAAVASLGFLPMALSNGAGAEVQRPLATVVIGGLITATALTLLVLPVLFLLFNKAKIQPKMKSVILPILFLVGAYTSQAQTAIQRLPLESVVEMAYQGAGSLQVSQLKQKYYTELSRSAKEIPKTQIHTEIGNYNSFNFDTKLSIVQPFASASVYKHQKTLLETYLESAKAQHNIEKATIRKITASLYLELQLAIARDHLMEQMDSTYTRMSQLADLRFAKGESNVLEKVTLENQMRQNRLMQEMNLSDKRSAQKQLAILMQSQIWVEPSEELNESQQLVDTSLLQLHPDMQYQQAMEKIAVAETNLAKSILKPDWFVGYNNQSIIGWQEYKNQSQKYFNAGNRFSSITAGLSFSLFNKAQKAKIAASKANEEVSMAITAATSQSLHMQMYQALEARDKYQQALVYYQKTGLQQTNVVMTTASLNYANGQINYIEWGTLINQSMSIRSNYLQLLKDIRMNEIEIHYLLSSN